MPRSTKAKNVTPTEHELLRQKARAVAATNLLNWTADLLGSAYARQQTAARSETLTAMKRKLSEHTDHYLTMTFDHLSAAESDLQAAEFQEAFDDLSKKLMARMEHLLK